MAEMLSSCDAFVTTSATTRDLIQRFFPITRRKPFPIIEHGRDFPVFQQVGHTPGPGERVRVLVPGNISTTKGARILKGIQALDREGRFEFHVLGQPSRELKSVPNVVTHGPYDRQSFGELTSVIDPHFGVVLSIWPETFCHTLTEMWASGLPVAAYDLGAVGERIRRHGGGWLIEPVTPEAAFQAFVAIAANPALLATKLAEVSRWQQGAGKLEDCAWMAQAYADLYQSVSQAGRIALPDKAIDPRHPARASGYGVPA
jgi:glycosyltransferase involved in cell wall biosynthesis